MSPKAVALAALLALLLVAPAAATGTCRYGPKRGFNVRRFRAKRAALLGDWPIRNRCFDGHICPLTAGCQNFPAAVTNGDCVLVGRRNRRWKCFHRCNDRRVPCVPVGGTGDPHLTGFDGSKFDFHGLHGQHFTFFEREGGDSVVVRTRTVAAAIAGTRNDLSFFSAAGVRAAAGGARVSAEAHFCEEDRAWQLGVAADGQPIMHGEHARAVSGIELKQLSRTKWAMRTAEAEYIVKLMWPEREHVSHINIHVRLLRDPTPGDVFRGVLGITLAPSRGLPTDDDLRAEVPPAAREEALLARFRVSALFPDGPAASP